MIAKRGLGVLISFLLFALVARADFTVPALTGPVVDEAGLLDSRTKSVIDDGLRSLLARGETQVNVLIVSSLEGVPIEQASIRVTDQWKLGTAKGDKGVLLLIAPKERALRIEVGQGLEGVLTDADSKRIISEAITPSFKQGRFDEGVLMGVVEIMRRTNPELNPQELFGQAGRARSYETQTGDVTLAKLIRWFLILMFVLFFLRPRRRRRGFASGLMWGAATGWGARGMGGGGWGGGGGGGGGWGGGGGGFSGGGASGNW